MKQQRHSAQVAVVTGSSRGIGKATAVALARAGFDVAVTATKAGGARAVAEEIRGLGRRALELRYDAGVRADADRLVKTVNAELGDVDVLVNNAGIVVRRPVQKLTDDEFDRVLRVNLSGPFYLSRRLVPQMARRKRGRIINVSSISATLGSPGNSAYAASKWGLDGLSKSLAEELRGTGVFVASILPGSVDTDMLKGSGFAPAMTADEVARVIVFLATAAPEAMRGSRVEMFG